MVRMSRLCVTMLMTWSLSHSRGAGCFFFFLFACFLQIRAFTSSCLVFPNVLSDNLRNLWVRNLALPTGGCVESQYLQELSQCVAKE